MTYEDAFIKVVALFTIIFTFYEAIKKIIIIYKAPSEEVKQDVNKKLANDLVRFQEIDNEIKLLKNEIKNLKGEMKVLDSIQSDNKMSMRVLFSLLQHEVTGNHITDMQELLKELGEYLNNN